MSRHVAKLLPIQSLAYWRSRKLQQCYLYGAFPKHVDNPPPTAQVPTKPQILGNVYHKAMEELSGLLKKNKSISIPMVTKTFNEVVERFRLSLMADSRVSYLAQDIMIWPQLTAIYRTLVRASQRVTEEPSNAQVHPEISLKSKDGLLNGQIDLLVEVGGDFHLSDYKSGSIWSSEGIKKDYVDQLYFYSYLVHEQFGKFPTKLTLIDLNGARTEVAPSPANSIALADGAKALLREYNDSCTKSVPIESLSKVGDQCSLCDVKLYCKQFWDNAKNVKLSQYAHSLEGRVRSITTTGTPGWVTVHLEVEMGTFKASQAKVIQVSQTRFPTLVSVGATLAISNLRLLSDGVEATLAISHSTEVLNVSP